jgi:hypothetical protein
VTSEANRIGSKRRLGFSREPRYCEEHDKKRGRERGGHDEERLIQTRLGDRPEREVASDTGPPIGEQPNVHHDVSDHAPGEKPEQYACAKHNGDHP